MISSNMLDQSGNEPSKYDGRYERVAVIYCQECKQIYCKEHSHLSKTLEALPLNPVLPRAKYSPRSIAGNLNDNVAHSTNDTSALSCILPKQINLSLLDADANDFAQTEVENKTDMKDDNEEETVVVIDSDTTPKITKKIQLSNNIVRWLRGPLKTMVSGTMHAVDLCAQGTHIKASVLQTVKKRIAEQKQQTTNDSSKSAYIEITSDWKLEGENSDKGFSSATKWINDPQGRRLLLKPQELAFGAFNEWIAYVVGKQMGLPVNEVQISVCENELVTLHTDATEEDEQTLTLLDLPEEKREKVMTTPIIESMDVLDHIIQNVDRNLRNILVTIPKTSDVKDDNLSMKIRLIDHSSCFGMGKLNFISIAATKFHSDHLSIVKFDPAYKAKQFEEYLTNIPVEDRPLISETLNRFAATTDEQFNSWLTEMQDLLTSNQYNRILTVLCQQRDITKRYIEQWGLFHDSLNVKPDGVKQSTSTHNGMH